MCREPDLECLISVPGDHHSLITMLLTPNWPFPLPRAAPVPRPPDQAHVC